MRGCLAVGRRFLPRKVRARHHHGHLCCSRAPLATKSESKPAGSLTLREIPVWEKENNSTIVLYQSTAQHDKENVSESPSPKLWKKSFENIAKKDSHNDSTSFVQYFLPAGFPSSVANGYAHYASYGFVASVAGSAAMVLSTQTLLLAVGVVGSNQEASVMAGAWNWVLKDGIGQFGGVWFAARQSHGFDADPKRWRMVAALALDTATLLEIISPLLVVTSTSFWVVAVASVANIGKNVGFLTASASRAALHQALTTKNNLADVTAKAGSQSIAASLVGTTLGIALSPILQDVPHFVAGFVVLSLIHQTCNYTALKSVPLTHFNHHRLHLVLRHYCNDNVILSPHEVASMERFLPGMPRDDTHKWLRIGSTVEEMGGPDRVMEEWSRRRLDRDDQYVVVLRDNGTVHLVFLRNANGLDCIKGMYHAHSLHYNKDRTLSNRNLESMVQALKERGWRVGIDQPAKMEPSHARRLCVQDGSAEHH